MMMIAFAFVLERLAPVLVTRRIRVPHILVRDVTDDGKMLIIAADYIGHDIRERASA